MLHNLIRSTDFKKSKFKQSKDGIRIEDDIEQLFYGFRKLE